MIPLHDDNPTTRFPYVTIGLIAASTLVFLWQQSLPPAAAQQAVYSFGMMPAVLFFVFRTFPAGLILYWTLFNVFSVLQTEFMHGKSKPETAPAK